MKQLKEMPISVVGAHGPCLLLGKHTGWWLAYQLHGSGICPVLSQIPSGCAQEHGRASMNFVQHSWKVKAMFGSEFLCGLQQVKCLPCKHEDLVLSQNKQEGDKEKSKYG